MHRYSEFLSDQVNLRLRIYLLVFVSLANREETGTARAGAPFLAVVVREIAQAEII